MMISPVIFRQNKEVIINSAANNVNLYTLAGSPTAPVNLYCTVNAAIGSTTSAYAFMTGTGWAVGSYLYIKNANTISGMANTTAGANGVGGAGGQGGSYPTAPVAGSAGGTGTNGNVGGPSFAANTVTAVKILLNNTGTITGGSGSSGGTGGGGGGGGGLYGRKY